MTFLLQVFVLVLACLATCSGQPLNGTEEEEVQPAANTCNSPFVEISGGCYSFHESAMNWHAARDYCRGVGAEGSKTDLATVVDCDQFSRIWQYIVMEYGGVYFWMGGSDEGQEGNWHWVTGDSMPLGHPFWVTGYPQNHPDDNCMAYQGNAGFFITRACTTSMAFVCQHF